MSVKLLTEHHLEFLSVEGGCTGSSESLTLVKMPHCWKSHAVAHLFSWSIKKTSNLHTPSFPDLNIVKMFSLFFSLNNQTDGLEKIV